MLKTLTVWNFALLESVEIEFEQGLNILTGETGAGKSILIDALGAVLGHRLTTKSIRTGCQWLRVEAIFTIAGDKKLKNFLQEQAIQFDEGNEDELIITRQLTDKGKNLILVNGCHVPLTILKKIGESLIDIHGQHENFALLKSGSQFQLLDQSDEKILTQKKIYEKTFEQYQKQKQSIFAQKQKAKERAERLDMLRWQAQEISSAHLNIDEEVHLEKEIQKLSNIEKISDHLEQSYALFNGRDDDGEGILSMVARVKQNLEAIERFDEKIKEILPNLSDILFSLQEIFYVVRDEKDDLEVQPEKLDELQSRLGQIETLEKKYGMNSAKKILDYAKKIEQEIFSLENYDANLEKQEEELIRLKEKLVVEAKKLTSLRKQAGAKLAEKIRMHLLALGMTDAVLEFSLIPTKQLTANGAEDIEILFSSNAGEEKKPLSKIISGGELSRLSLAIKTVAVANDNEDEKKSAVRSMIFDEIDTGIGGMTAQMVAQRIAWVSKYKQVLCVTHLPQIACMADAHYSIAKQTSQGKTTTQIKKLTENERVAEIARMASGMDKTEISLQNAREMLLNAKKLKQVENF